MIRQFGVFLSLATLAFTGAAAAGPSGMRHFGDWYVGCDNALTCRAIQPQEDQGDDAPYIVLDRDGGPDARPRLHFGGTGVSLDKDLAWKVDDKPPVLAPASAVTQTAAGEDGTPGISELGDPAATGPLLAAMRDGTAVSFAATLAELPAAKPIALKGLAAALLFMDDVQGRVGTVTALARLGTKPASAVPAVPPLPLIVPDPLAKGEALPDEAPKSVMARHLRSIGKDTECEDFGDRNDISVRQLRLSGDRILILIACWRAAYQAGETAYLATSAKPDAAAPLLFETVDEASGKVVATMKSVTDADGFDDDPAQFASFHKGRGIGDCGTGWTWTWSRGKMRLTSYVTMPACRGIGEDSGDWFTLFRSRPK